MLDPAEEPERRGAVFGFDLLGVLDDHRPDAPELRDWIGVIVDAKVVVHARLAEGGHEQGPPLLSPPVTPRPPPRPPAPEETPGQAPLPAPPPPQPPPPPPPP